MKNYKIVIVLCPSESKVEKNGDVYFEELSKNEKRKSLEYLGGQIRMDAAVDLALTERVKGFFIVVGGNQKKVDDMKKYITEQIEKSGKISPPIIRIESTPDTNSNLQAIKKILGKEMKFKNGETAILTNFYHIPRSLRFAADIFPEYNFIPLAAESLIIKHQPTYTLYPKEFLLRISDDIDGLRDWEAELYKEQNRLEKDVKAICYETELLKKLLNGT